MNDELKNNSALSTHNSELTAGVWLKETAIQQMRLLVEDRTTKRLGGNHE